MIHSFSSKIFKLHHRKIQKFKIYNNSSKNLIKKLSNIKKSQIKKIKKFKKKKTYLKNNPLSWKLKNKNH